jgi:hypothetical protein
MTGRGYLPKIVLCVPGGDDLRARCEPLLNAGKVEYEFRGRDANMVRAFVTSSMTWPCFSADDFARIGNHTTVLYALTKNFTAGEAAAVDVAFLKLGRQLLEAGGIAIKCESSGISHSRERWTKFADLVDRSESDKFLAPFHALVVYPIGSETDLYTCGMHLLGAGDLILSQDVIQRTAKEGESVASAAQLFRTFALYLLGECPVGKFVSGHTFSVDRDAPRYRVVWEPCVGFAEDSFFFNSFGRWRFTGA